jgi:hypothetical protein
MLVGDEGLEPPFPGCRPDVLAIGRNAEVVRTAGFEPALTWLSTRRLCQLGYIRLVRTGGLEPPLGRV